MENFLTAKKSDKRYYCIDTFGGFQAAHVASEVATRGKQASDLTGFRVNSYGWFGRMLALNGVTRVTAYKADAATFDYTALGDLCFALVDVDLYEPTRQALPAIWHQLVPGGVLVVDDCDQGTHIFDGARQAAAEFGASVDVELQVRGQKLGVLRKNHTRG
jgi:hypothetical protein